MVTRKNVSLVLGSGGARGIAHIGVIKYLMDNNVCIDEIVGCSIGAIVGAAFAEGKINELAAWMEGLTKGQVFKLMDFSDPRFGFLKGEKVLNTLKEVFKDVNIEDLPLQYTAIATDLIKEEEVLFRTGSVYTAIRASIAIPAVFKGIDYEGRFLVDGGVLNPVPVNHVQRKSNIVIAVNLDGASGTTTDFDLSKLNAIGMLKTSYFAMRRKLSDLSMTLHRPDYCINIAHDSAEIWDFHRSADLIKLGYVAAAESLPQVLSKSISG